MKQYNRIISDKGKKGFVLICEHIVSSWGEIHAKILWDDNTTSIYPVKWLKVLDESR